MDLLINTGVKAERVNTEQATKNTDENQGTEPLTFEERVARGAKHNFISSLNEEDLADPSVQKMLDAMDSPEHREWVKEAMANGPSFIKLFDVLESQGVPVDREMFAKLFHETFPTGEPEDYEPEMRLEMAKLFLAAEPVDLTNPMEAHMQRHNVYYEFIKQDTRNFAWHAGQFGAGWDGVLQRESNPALEWLRVVQHNAAGIVAAAETAEVNAFETPKAATPWDLSSVMESSSASDSETEMPATFDTSASVPMTDAEIEAENEKSLTPQPPDIPQNQRPETAGEIQNNLEITLKAQFSSERFEQAMDTLDRYGPEEGLRRLRENDPEVAKRIEQHRKREEVSQ